MSFYNILYLLYIYLLLLCTKKKDFEESFPAYSVTMAFKLQKYKYIVGTFHLYCPYIIYERKYFFVSAVDFTVSLLTLWKY